MTPGAPLTEVHLSDPCERLRKYEGRWHATAACGWHSGHVPDWADADAALKEHAATAHPVQWELAGQIEAHALAHYCDGGWDVVAECWTRAQITEFIGRATTLAGALRKFEALVDVWADREADAVNSAF